MEEVQSNLCFVGILVKRFLFLRSPSHDFDHSMKRSRILSFKVISATKEELANKVFCEVSISRLFPVRQINVLHRWRRPSFHSRLHEV